MIFITEFLKRRIEKDKAYWADINRVEEESKKKAKVEMSIMNMDMENKPCPIRDGQCSQSCVHFKKAGLNAYEFDIFTTHPVTYYAIEPKCKLWGKH